MDEGGIYMMLASILDFTITVATWLVIVIGCLVTLCLLMYPVNFLLNVIYNRTKASIYFISYIKNRKEFIKWRNETKPDVYTPKMK
jgi:hypothetical protein